MSSFALIVNTGRARAVDMAREAARWLVARGHEVHLSKEDAEAAGLHDLGVEPDALVDGADLALALGGDGTMLRAFRLAAPHGTALLGVNLGRLAYLSAVEPEALCPALDRFVAGDFDIEERTLVTVAVNGGATTHLGLNEAVVEKNSPGHTLHLAVAIRERFFTSHVSDAVIVATPTGSTAYSFSAGGPIVSPRLEALIVTPVASHTPFTHSLVLHPDEPVRVEVLDARGAVLSVDGLEVARLGQGDAVTCTVAPERARFVTFGERDFYGVLKAKFGLADR